MPKLQVKLLFAVWIGVLSQPSLASDDIETAGDVLQILIPAVALGSTVYLDDSDGTRQFFKSFLTNIVVTHGLKNTVAKKRPSGSDKSFPSGHTSAAFQGAAFIHQRYGWKYSALAYVGASYVGYSRVVTDHHFSEDVVAGAIIGALSAGYFTSRFNGVNIVPQTKNGQLGLSINMRW